MTFKRYIIIRAICVLSFLSAGLWSDAAPVWERVGSTTTEVSEPVTADAYELKISDNVITLKLANKTSVKVFTILGQLVAEKQLEGGTWRLQMPARGIYILKVGSATRRITI